MQEQTAKMLTITTSQLTLYLLISSFCSAFTLPSNDHTNEKRPTSLPDYAQRNLNTIRKIYNLTVYPNNAPIVARGAAAVPPGLFSQLATGRVSPVGNFSGFDDSIEYFFALAPTPQASSGLGIYQADVLEFTSGCPEVAASLVYLRTGHVDEKTGALDKTKPTSTLSHVRRGIQCNCIVIQLTCDLQVAFWRFDDQGQVLKYHAWIPNLQAWIGAVIGYDPGTIAVQTVAKVSLCPPIQQQCTGSNKQYRDELDRIARLQLKPFGNFDEAWGDNIACRTRVRPDVHCLHVGPRGGSPPDNYKCVNIDYSKDYFDDGALFGAPEGDVFTCGGRLLSGGTNP
jgi:hypothetical protein